MGPLKGTPLGYQQILAATLAAATPLTVPAGANFALLKAETASIRWRDDGTDPSATVGMVLASTDPALEYWGDLGTLKAIALSGSPILNVSYYRAAG